MTTKASKSPRVTRWPRTGSVTVDRGPLSYSVRIPEQWKRCGGTDAWPEWEVLPAGDWNYALAVGDGQDVSPLRAVEKDVPAGQPWTVDAAPIQISAPARKVRGWRIGDDQTVQPLPDSPSPESFLASAEYELPR